MSNDSDRRNKWPKRGVDRKKGRGSSSSPVHQRNDTAPKRAPKNTQRHSVKDIQTDFLKGIGVPKQAEKFSPDEFQLAAIQSVTEGHDTLVVAPTGTGKTYIAVQGIAQAISSGKRAVYTAPLKALSNTKYTEFRKRFEPHFRVGLLTGDRKIDGDADIVVATTEIYRNELYNYGENYSLVVLDEFHYLADSQRGPVWEESIILSPNTATLLMLSASVSNALEIAEWIESVRGRPVKIITETHRPVELRLGFLHPQLGVLPLEDEEKQILKEVSDFYSIKNQGQTRIRGMKNGGNYRGGAQGREGGGPRGEPRGSKNFGNGKSKSRGHGKRGKGPSKS